MKFGKGRQTMSKIDGMHPYLEGLEKFNVDIPLYVKNPFTSNHIQEIRDVINTAKNTRPLASIPRPGDQEDFFSLDRFDPRITKHMSRMVIEFKCPENVEKAMDSYVFPIYKENIKLGHYSYLDYNPKYGDKKYFPSLPPHIDAANTLVTFNYCLDTNIEWDLYIDNKPYSLAAGDAIIFSAINQVHWRPKREWSEGDFCEILSFDYSPLDDWRFTNESYPLDETLYPERVKAYMEDLDTRKEYIDAWELYTNLGLKINLDQNTHGKIKNGTTANNN